jgi:hypothetical protein
MAIAKLYNVGDTVHVAYPFPSSNYFTPIERVVASVDVISDTDNKATVRFTQGKQVVDSDAITTVWTTQILAAKAIVDDAIIKLEASVLLDTSTTTLASASGQVSLNVGRVDS